ncbi:hypothetical protein EK21DRAFT_104588 [Setomelanomma holmii]|uniref:Glycosyltransferase 2 n=1 Tax=Setomelanomma holmii TaxID=210430 RepID=A0A9P4LHX4_9PLEO|nr:hypothetical protein EK21DRAFT_104588 [Setomelanomma holmii]
MLPGDEELGKKDDDHRFAPARRSGWSIWNHTFRWRRRRILLVIAGLLLAYMLLSRFGANGSRYPLGIPSYDYSHAYDEPVEPTGPPPGLQVPRGTTPHTFDGHIRFYRLARTLRKSASQTNGYEKTNRNILFALSSLKSGSTLIPMICEMAKWSRSHVHVAFFGREDIPLEDLLEINGVDKEKCPALWHDARPDYMEYSSDTRAQSAVVGALSHVHSFLHPQVAIMDDSLLEDGFFVRGIRAKTDALNIPLVEVPKDKADDLMWMTRLDAGSLSSWHRPTVDILIQVPPDSSSVLRLLQSIKKADYSGLKPPRIILELPTQLDVSVKRHIENFKWPLHTATPSAGSSVTLRRRILTHRTTQEDAAIRFLELFYPANTANSHVLLLSPQAQLSPLYFHYLHYALLEYKYSSFGQEDSSDMMGVSLELPSVLLDGKSKLPLPTLDDMYTNRYKRLFPTAPSTPFLWQAPNSHATLFFGDKWAELHSYLGNRVIKHQEGPKMASRIKLITESLPAWTEYMLEFMRARGYSLLYPTMSSETLVTVHNELYHMPEEYTPASDKQDSTTLIADADEPFLRAEIPPRPPNNPEPPLIGSKSLHLALPFDGDLPEVPHMPRMLYDGQLVHITNVSKVAREYADKFREEVGGCTIPKVKHRKVVPGETRDLFCFGDEDANDWENDVSEVLFKAPVVDPHEKIRVDEKEPPLTAWPQVSTKARTILTGAKTVPTATIIEADDW